MLSSENVPGSWELWVFQLAKVVKFTAPQPQQGWPMLSLHPVNTTPWKLTGFAFCRAPEGQGLGLSEAEHT